VEVVKQIDYAEMMPGVVIVSCIISCATSFAGTRLSRAVVAFRAAFLAYMAFDIVIAIAARYEVDDYIANVVFNFIGSFVFGGVLALIVNRFVPEQTQTDDGGLDGMLPIAEGT
jgi:hypothetical protein